MSSIRYCFCISLLVFNILLGAKMALGQHQIRHQVPAVAERGSTMELTFDAPGINPGDVQDAFLFYRTDGSVAYKQEKLEFRQSVFSVFFNIPSQNASSLEYYIQIQFNDGSIQTYPADGAAGNPVRIEIVESRQAEQTDTGTEKGIEYTILSPEQGEDVMPGDVVIAITLFYEDEAIDTTTSSFQLLLDEEDITEEADASAYFLTYVPDNLYAGEHTVSLRIKTDDTTEEIVTWSFFVADTDEATALTLQTDDGRGSDNWSPAGDVELTARNQMIAGNINDALSGNIRLNGQKGDIRYSAYGLLTSQEDPRLQPQNRYGVEFYVGDILELRAGHIYPVLSSLTIAGHRVQGINAVFRPFDQAVNLQFVYGKLRREISNIYSPIQVQPQSFNDMVVDTSYTLDIQDEGFGTFQRDIIGGRLDFGRSQMFKMGFNLLKVQDDTNSISVISNYRDLINTHPEMTRSLTLEDKNKLANDPNLLSVSGNPVPKGNVVAGSDLRINFDDNHIQFRVDAAVSLLNEDISGGILTSDRADELGFEMDGGVENMLDRLSWLIIINENVTPLPLRFNINGEESNARPYFPMGVLATQSELSFNYFKNNLRLQYRWAGPDFNSLANSTVRKDIAGFSVSDRFRLFSNRVYVTLGFENLNDNVANNKDATTNSVTLRSNISWYPIRQDLPRVSVGLMNRNRKNGVSLFNPYVVPSLESTAARNYEVLEGAIAVAPNPRRANTIQFTSSVSQQFEMSGLIHDVSLNYSLLNTTDDVFAYGDAKSNSISFNLTNRFPEMPLNTRFGFSFNNTQTGSGLTNTNILGFNLGGSVFLLEDRINVNAALAFTRNKTKATPLTIGENGTPGTNADDYYKADIAAGSESRSHAYIFNAGGRYTIDQNHAIVVDARFTNVTSPLSNLHFPNDRIAQLRYVYSF